MVVVPLDTETVVVVVDEGTDPPGAVTEGAVVVVTVELVVVGLEPPKEEPAGAPTAGTGRVVVGTGVVVTACWADVTVGTVAAGVGTVLVLDGVSNWDRSGAGGANAPDPAAAVDGARAR